MLTSLTKAEIKSLTIQELVQRMDDVRVTAEIERMGKQVFDRWYAHPNPPFAHVSDILQTQKVNEMGDVQQRRLVDAAFRFLFQIDMLKVSSGISNAVVYGSNYSESLWSSPKHWMKYSVLSQYDIIASRIALECFFDLLYIADQGERMSGRSKFKNFCKWISKEENPYKYFVAHIVKSFEFDREHRQREVHGTSKFAQSILRLEIPNSEERNTPLELINILLSVWEPFIRILNGERPQSISVFTGLEDFATQYFDSHKDPEIFNDFIDDLFERKMK